MAGCVMMCESVSATELAGYSIRQATLEEWRTVMLTWSGRGGEGWNPGLGDTDAFFDADPHGFFFGVMDSGEIVASISAVKYGPDQGFLSSYIVKKGHRGNGYGLRLFQHAMRYLQGRAVSLYGELNQVGNYEKSAFRAGHTITSFVAKLKNVAGVSREYAPPAHLRVGPISELSWERIQELDLACISRVQSRAMIERFVGIPGLVGYYVYSEVSTAAAADVPGGDAPAAVTEVLGFVCCRPSDEGCKIGPWYALTAPAARLLLTRLLSSRLPAPDTVPDPVVTVDVPAEGNGDAVDIVTERGFRPYAKLTYMCRSGDGPTRAPEYDTSVQFGIWSLQVG